MLGFFIWQVKGNTRKSGEHIENQHPPGQVLPVFPFVWCPGVFTTCGSWSNKQPGQGSVLEDGRHMLLPPPPVSRPRGRIPGSETQQVWTFSPNPIPGSQVDH